MLNQQTIDRLYNMKLFAMAEAFSEQMDNPQMAELSFPDRFGLIIDRQWCEKEEKRMQRLLNNAKLKIQACVEDIDYAKQRGLDKSTMMHLISCQWIRNHHNVVRQNLPGMCPGPKSVPRWPKCTLCPCT
jgi:hypothetical protein